jgi:hypothetical protein
VLHWYSRQKNLLCAPELFFFTAISETFRAIQQYFSLYFAGPGYDYLLNYQSELMDDALANFEKVVFGATIGIGIVSNHSQFLKTLLELRYNMDFSDSYKPAEQEGKNNTFDVRVGFSL